MAETKKLTPMMEHYMQVKAQYPDCLLFYRLGDFYELFMEDAKVAARELELTLTTRDRNKPPEEQVPMCGVPHQSLYSYLARLTTKGYKVAICDQMQDPAQAKGLVERDVSRIITPGTSLDLESDDNNFMASFYMEEEWAGLAFADLSTGECEAMAFKLPEEYEKMFCALEARDPVEMVCNSKPYNDMRVLTDWIFRTRARVEPGVDDSFEYEGARDRMLRQFHYRVGVLDMKRGERQAVQAVGGLLTYFYTTQRANKLLHLQTISFIRDRTYMDLDRQTRRNLELTETLWDKEKRGSLLWVLDKTKTPMGRRLMKTWIERPLISAFQIKARQNGVTRLVKDTPLREDLREALSPITDLERLVARLGCGNGGPREMADLINGLRPLAVIKKRIAEVKTEIIKKNFMGIDTLERIILSVDLALVKDDLPLTVREGGIFAPGYDREIDRLQNLIRNSDQTIAELAARERERTGIKGLKVGYNKVFGYYLEVSNSYKNLVPADYIRKQTLVNGERYITPELKELEEEILTARERCADREYLLFKELRDQVLTHTRLIQRNARCLAELDVLCSLAQVAVDNRYVRPTVDKSGVLKIEDGRHPVVERTLKDQLFVANSIDLDGEARRLVLITGPNMAGKSTYMRQVGLIVLMAQMGSYVPAKSATLGVVDRVFTRIGASDDLNNGQSTFMVEMTELSDILKQATPKSLLLLDELGRGTSTYDGMSIARAVLEYCAGTVKAKTLLSTHYHELIAAAEETPGAINVNVAAKKRDDTVIFLRKIVPGGADESYGVDVAQLAGLPEPVIRRAREVLSQQEAAPQPRPAPAAGEQPRPDPRGKLMDILRTTVPETITPLEAMSLLVQLRGLALEEVEGP